MRWMCVGLLLLLGFGSLCEGGSDPYGRPVPYALNADTRFPDLTVRFIGVRREYPKVYPRGFPVYDFEIISTQGTRVTVSWSSGTGQLGPVAFSVDGVEYFLELKADSLATDPAKRWLKENELILWKKDVYLKRQKELTAPKR